MCKYLLSYAAFVIISRSKPERKSLGTFRKEGENESDPFVKILFSKIETQIEAIFVIKIKLVGRQRKNRGAFDV